MTLALPRTGFLSRDAAPAVGELYLADISVPPELYAGIAPGMRVGVPLGAAGLVRLNVP